jgi:hypothetical protein
MTQWRAAYQLFHTVIRILECTVLFLALFSGSRLGPRDQYDPLIIKR